MKEFPQILLTEVEKSKRRFSKERRRTIKWKIQMSDKSRGNWEYSRENGAASALFLEQKLRMH